MDVLSDVMAVLRTGQPFVGRFAWDAPWGKQFAAMPDAAGFQAITRGSCVLTTTAGEVLDLNEGDVVFFPHAGKHTLADSRDSVIESPCDPASYLPRESSVIRTDEAEDATASHATVCGSYELALGRTHPLLTGMPDLVYLPSDDKARPEISGAVTMLNNELRKPLSGSDAIVPALLDAMLMFILRSWFDNQGGTGDESGWAAALGDVPVSSALQAIHTEPEVQWTVESLSDVAGLSRSAFSRRFTALVGDAPLGYLTSWRMTLAAKLLRESDVPLSSVARKVGYNSEFAFATAFKRAFRLPPGQYRRH